MSVVAQRVVVIQDASRDVSSSAIKWAIDGLSLKSGDELTLLGVLHQVNTPSTFPFKGARKLSKSSIFFSRDKGRTEQGVGYKSRIDSNSMLDANEKIVNEEVSRKEEEYQNSKEMLEISMLYETRKIDFNKRVVAASSPKVAALEAAKKLGATWIILDRQMKKDKKYFMERLSCGISRMKRNNSVELLRSPVHSRKRCESTDRSQSSIRCDEMLPGRERKPETSKMIQGTPEDDDFFSLELYPSKSKSSYKKSSNDEVRTEYGEGNLRASLSTSSLSASTSSENLPILDQRNHDSLLVSNSNVAKHASHQLQEERGYVHTQRETLVYDSSVATSDHREVQRLLGNEAMNHEIDQKQGNIIEETLGCGFIDRLEEREEKPVCSNRGDEDPKFETRNDFTYAELYTATNGFSGENFLSEGGFGSVYKGRLKNGQWIAVKQHKPASLQGEKEFRSEVHVLSKVRHKNVVMLLGSCSEGSHQLLVYEYVSNGSLDSHLSKDNPNVLCWRDRMNIALGAAKGLNYLHRNNIIHRDMRPNNILVNHEYEPLLGDFGLAKAQHETNHSADGNVVGTIGYLAPEYAEKGRASAKADVYSFGVVLLELITGRTTMDKSLKEKSLVGWARPLLKERKYPELIDERILDCHDMHQLFGIISVAEKCLSKDPEQRPSMEKVECALKRIMDGETVSGMEEFSPMNASFYNLDKSNESQHEQEADLQECVSSDASPHRARTNQAPSLPQCSSRSPGASKNSEGSLPGKRKGHRKRAAKSRSQPIPYDEMLS